MIVMLVTIVLVVLIHLSNSLSSLVIILFLELPNKHNVPKVHINTKLLSLHAYLAQKHFIAQL